MNNEVLSSRRRRERRIESEIDPKEPFSGKDSESGSENFKEDSDRYSPCASVVCDVILFTPGKLGAK